MSFLFAHRRGYGVVPAAGRGTLPPSADGESPAEVQRKTPRPLGANPLTQFVCPGQPVQRKEPPVRANTLTQFVCPAQPVQRNRLPPGKGEPFTRFGHTGKSVPRNLRSKSARRSALPTFSLVQCRKMRYTYFI